MNNGQQTDTLRRNQSQSYINRLPENHAHHTAMLASQPPVMYQYSNFGQVNQYNGYNQHGGGYHQPSQPGYGQFQTHGYPSFQEHLAAAHGYSGQTNHDQHGNFTQISVEQQSITVHEELIVPQSANISRASVGAIPGGDSTQIQEIYGKDERHSIIDKKEQTNIHSPAAVNPREYIDPKYVAEIESNLGKLRIENLQQKERIDMLEKNQRIEADKREITTRQLERLSKDASTAAEYAEKYKKAQQLADLSKDELAVKDKAITKLQEENFHLTFNRVDYDSICRDNATLKLNLSQAHSALEDLKQKFVNYTWLVSPNAEIAAQRENSVRELELVNSH